MVLVFFTGIQMSSLTVTVMVCSTGWSRSFFFFQEKQNSLYFLFPVVFSVWFLYWPSNDPYVYNWLSGHLKHVFLINKRLLHKIILVIHLLHFWFLGQMPQCLLYLPTRRQLNKTLTGKEGLTSFHFCRHFLFPTARCEISFTAL